MTFVTAFRFGVVPARRLVHEAKDRPPNQLAMIVDAARDQPSNLEGKIAPEPVSLFLVERIGVTADNGPGRLEYSRQGNIVEFG